MRIPVLNADGQPLSPCRPARARLLLQQQKAHIVSRRPFAIQLTTLKVQPTMHPMILGGDDGKTVGFAVVEQLPHVNRVVCQVTLPTRGQRISDQLKARKAIRAAQRNRRNHRHGRVGETKIFFRKHAPYPPSIRADVQAKLNVIRRLQHWYPITAIAFEIVQMDV
ncbi:MAG: RRXRR domain-containing protein, partial [Sulfobacillus sp.]